MGRFPHLTHKFVLVLALTKLLKILLLLFLGYDLPERRSRASCQVYHCESYLFYFQQLDVSPIAATNKNRVPVEIKSTVNLKKVRLYNGIGYNKLLL